MNNIICGIYMIKNKINNKVYIGQAIDIKDRWNRGHIKPLNKNKHDNNHLQASWNKYGDNNFEFSIIEECKEELLNEREIYWIEYYDSFKNGYNRTLGGEGCRGFKHSEETKQLLSEKSKKNNPKYWKGKQMSDETKQRLSESIKLTFKNMPEEKKKQMKINQNLNRKPCPISNELKEKLRIINSRPMAEETKKKLSQAQKKLTEKQELEIINLINQGIEGREIAKQFNVVPATISNTKRRNIDKVLPQYKHKQSNGNHKPRSEETKRKMSEMRRKFNYKQEMEIIKLLNTMKNKDIAKLYNVSPSVISGIKKKYIK